MRKKVTISVDEKVLTNARNVLVNKGVSISRQFDIAWRKEYGSK